MIYSSTTHLTGAAVTDLDGQCPAVPAAAELFCVLLDDRTGSLAVNHRIAGPALAGAMLGELVLTNRIVVHNGRLSFMSDSLGGRHHYQSQVPSAYSLPSTPADQLTRVTLDDLMSEPGTVDVEQWLRYYALDAVERVGVHTARLGWLHLEETRRWLFGPRTMTYRIHDVKAVPWRAPRMTKMLNEGTIIEWRDTFTACLIDACGNAVVDHLLLERAVPGLDLNRAKLNLRTQVSRAAQRWPDLHELHGLVRSLVREGVATPRT